uniref:Actin interacting protein 3-like C-terminal domain-containing protein n=1 Tax=Cyprinus carpio TaxID=7962 RepID=A0A8C2IYB9_CYPCA
EGKMPIFVTKICVPASHRRARHQKPLKGNLKVTSSEDAEHLARKHQVVSASSPGSRCEAKSSRAGVPRRHTVGGARSSQEILAMQPSDMDKKREAFLEHLKQKYPHHASAIMGHQERLREQSRGPKQSVACSSPVPVFVDQVEHGSQVSLDAMEVMSECDMPIAFTRGSRSRASLPVVRSTNQTKDRSLGVLYLQYGDDTKQIRMPNEITSVDTIRALFVSAFPHQLNMKMLESPSTAIYVKDETRNVYYELTDVRSITDHSCLKVYHKDPAHAFSHGARPSNGDARVHREMMYAGPSGHPLRQPPMGPPPPHMQGSMSPTTPHAMPPSPSRIPFGPRISGGGVATMPRERAGHTLPAPARASSPCPSAILERRDVKPDEDVAAKSMSLPARAESHYADPYMLHHHAPPPDTVDHAYHRATMRSYSNPGVPIEPTDHPSLFRQKSRKYTDSQLPMLGSKTPPPSPHRMGEMRVMDIHTVQPQSSMTLERASPIRQSFRKEAPLVMDTMVKARGGMGSPATPDLQVHNPLAPSTDPQTREKPVKSGSPAHSTSSTGSPILAPKVAAAPPECSPAPTPPLGPAPLHVNLHLFRKNVSELRLQLQHMRQLQLQNQECVRAQIKRVEQEISVKLAEMLRRQEDPAQKQRTLVEEERHRYLSMQERVLTQLGDLEQYVETLRTDSSPAVSQRAVTLKEVEEGAVSLRKVGENLAGLKGEFPALQSHMRAVLRVEVEAVKFLKEEPHKLDSMLKRVRTLTDTLSNLRRSATDSLLKPSDPDSSTPASEKPESAVAESVAPQSSTVRSEVMTSNPVVIHHAQATPVASQQSQQSTAPSPIPSAAQRRESTPSPTKQLKKPSLEQTLIPNNSSNGVSSNGIHGKGPSPNFIEEIHASCSKNKNRAVSIEAAEKEWEEKRQNMGHYDGQEFERMLQEAEANMLRGIPNLEVPSEPEGSPAVVPATLQEPNSEKPTKTLQTTEKANKSPPPPPPRRNYTSNTGMTTTRSGEVIYTSRKESVMVQLTNHLKYGSLFVSFFLFLFSSVWFKSFLQNASVVSPTSRMPVPVSAKARQQPGTSEKERATKPQKLQDSQRQFRQANGSAKRSGGDPKSTSPTVPASKIPAFSSSTGKSLSQSDSTNIVHSSSPLSSSLPTSKSSIPPPRSNSTPSSHIPSLSNGSLKFAPPTHSTKGLSIPTQTQNGRPSSSSSSSCSHSPLSPTMLSQSAKSIRTIHTPSFTSYSRPHNGNAGKSAIPTVTLAKDAA